MTDEELRIKVAELCGWTVVESGGEYPFTLKDPNGQTVGPMWMTREGALSHGLPMYESDLNAMHEAEKTLTQVQYQRFRTKLINEADTDEANEDEFCRAIVSATARQRAEAFVATLHRMSLGDYREQL